MMAFCSSQNSRISINNVSSESTNNDYGFCSEMGSIITYGYANVDTLGSSHTVTGGRIYTGQQTSIDNY